ncbi:hypothetical protein JCM3770_004278 [Rhodotorula araucariae]
MPQSSPASLAQSLTHEILRELVLDVAIQEHRLAGLRRSRAATAAALGVGGVANGLLTAPMASGAGAGTSPSKDGLFQCLVCSRQIAAPRYASHLSGCMGLTGSRRGAERRAAAAANGKSSGASRPPSVASSHGSDTDSAVKGNGVKRTATASPAGGGPKLKKQKPTPMSSPANGHFLPPHTGSHPLSKTLSLPSSPLTPASSPSASALPTPGAGANQPRIPHQLPQQHMQAPQMHVHKSLPGASGYGPPPPGPATGSKRPPHPLAQSPLHVSAKKRAADSFLMSDRPESDSEDSDAEVAKPQAQKTPRVPPGAPASGSGAGASAGAAAATGGAAPQKAPRKAPGRKVVPRPVDSGSESDDVPSEGSDSD